MKKRRRKPRKRKVQRSLWRRLSRPRWLLLFACALALSPLVLLNVAVAFFGQSVVSPLSLRHMESKRHALGRYLDHRANCLFKGHNEEFSAIIARVAQKNRIDEHLLAALVEVESGSRAHRISRAGAMGPAQLIPSTARMLGVRDPFDPEQGIDGGARYLRTLLKRFDGEERLALAGYNAGPGNVRDGQIPRYGETEIYVERVLASARQRRARAASR